MFIAARVVYSSHSLVFVADEGLKVVILSPKLIKNGKAKNLCQ